MLPLLGHQQWIVSYRLDPSTVTFPSPTRLDSVSISLLTEDGRFSSLFEEQVRCWRVANPDRLRADIVDALGIRGEIEEDTSVERRVFFLDPDNLILYSPNESVEEASVSDLNAHHLVADHEDGSSWDDWWGVQLLIGEMALQAARRGEGLAFVVDGAPGDVVTLHFGESARGQPVVQVSSPWRPHHEVWRLATEHRDRFVLEAPLNDEMLTAAGELVKVALRDQGHHPIDVYPTIIRT